MQLAPNFEACSMCTLMLLLRPVLGVGFFCAFMELTPEKQQ